jgi:hypothetical protein
LNIPDIILFQFVLVWQIFNSMISLLAQFK